MSEGSEFSYETLAVPPGAVFVAAEPPLLVFPSVLAAQSYLEPIDVVEGVYPSAYGPSGEPYRIRCQANRVLIECTGESNRPDELKVLLLRYLEACEDPADATQSLEELVAIAWSIERDYSLRNDRFGERFGTQISTWGCVAIAIALGALWYFA